MPTVDYLDACDLWGKAVAMKHRERMDALKREASFLGAKYQECDCGCVLDPWWHRKHSFALTFPTASWVARARSAWLRAAGRFHKEHRNDDAVFDADAWLVEWSKRNPRPQQKASMS